MQRVVAFLQSRMVSTVGSNFLVFGLQAIHAILLARLLGPQGRGEYGTAMFYAQLLIYVGLMGTLFSIARMSENWKSDFAPLQRSAIRVGLITGICAMTLSMLLVLIAIPAAKKYLVPYCLICCMLLPWEHMRLTCLAVDHGRGTFRRYNLSNVVAAAIFPALVLGLYISHIDSLWVVSCLTVIVPLSGLAFYLLVSDNRKWFGELAVAPTRLIRDGAQDGLSVLATDLYDRLGVFLVLWLVTIEGLGNYLTAVPAAQLLVVAPNALALFAFKAAANHQRKITVTQAVQSILFVLALQVTVVFLLSTILESLLLFIYGQRFIGTVPVAQVLLLAMAACGCAIVGDGYLRGRQRAILGVWTRVFGMLTMLMAAVLIDHPNPLLRVAWATACGHFVNAILIIWLVLNDVRRVAALPDRRIVEGQIC